MSSAEVFCWGPLGPVPGEDNPAPVGAARSGLVRQVYAGPGCALLARAKDVKWLPDQVDLGDNNGDNSIGDDARNLPGVKCAAFGESHTLLLRNIGGADEDSAEDTGGEAKTEVLAWGSGRQGQLGLGAGMLESKFPKVVPALSTYRVVQVACGAQHSAAVTSYGDLFTWGRGIEGQLGHASRHLPPELNDAITGVQLRPKPVPAFLATKKRQRPVAGVSCGVNFTLVVTRSGGVWAFGGGTMGQLGIGRLTSAGVPNLVMPSCPDTGEPFVEVAAGWAHALARTSGGRVYSWGFNALGSLGLGDHRTRFFPEVVPLGGRQKHGVDDDDGSGGMIGGEFVSSSSHTTKTADSAAIKVHACGNCSGALTAEGELFTWGCSSNADGLGQRGGGELRRSRPERVEHILQPQRVKRLVGAEVTDFALSNKGGIALVPLRVQSIEPASGPLETGCKVLIQGYGFWDSPDIVVKFTPVSKGHKPPASRSAVGTYVPREAGQGGNDPGNGTEFLTCTAPCFASPEAVYVEVSVDGTTFTTDCTRFQYYRTPHVAQITPDICRPPFPTMRLDGEHLRPNETLLVRFEEEQEESTEGTNGGCEEGSSLFDNSTPFEGISEDKAPLPPRSPPRVFTVPGRVESEIVEVGTDPDTELPIHEERWFLTCDSPALPPEAKLPFISRLTVAPNGANFNGEPLRFVAHDPHADLCLPPAVPVPVPPPLGGDEDEHSEGEAEPKGPCIRITGRNLYRGTDLAVRLRFGLDDENIVPFHTVSFDAASESIVGVVPMEAGELVAGAVGAASKEPQAPPAISVVVEVTVDGWEYFAVPERLTLFRGPHLTLQGDGLYPAAGGGWAELKTKESTFRGHDAKVRLVSDIHGLDVTLPLLSSPPPEEVEEEAEEASEVPCSEEGGGDPPPVRPPSAGANKKKPPSVQEPAKGAAKVELEGSCDGASTRTPDKSVWEEREVPASGEPFYFAVPPLPKPTQGDLESCGGNSFPDGQGRDAAAAATASIPGDQSVNSKPQPAPTSPKSPGAGGEDQDMGETAGSEEANTAVSLLVSLNGDDWQPVLGPPLTYFQPPPEPVVEPEEETKKGKGKKK